MKARKQSLMKEQSTRILPQTLENQHLQSQQKCKHGKARINICEVNKSVSMVKQIFSFIFASGWCIGKLEIWERQARHVNN
jgi:hypothetical protein